MDGKTTVARDEPAPRPTLWSLRPAGEHAGLRRAAQGAGWRLRTLSMQRLVARDACGARDAAMACPLRLHTSPAAVRFALRGMAAWPAGVDLAVGEGTAAALRAAGAVTVRVPARMDSEGVLALAELQAVGGLRVGLLTAPRGRGLLARTLEARGARLSVAEVYARVDLHGGARRVSAFIGDEWSVLLVSSAEAFDRLRAKLPPPSTDVGDRARARTVVVSSLRLAERVRAAGFFNLVQAAGPTPAALVEAACTVAPYTSKAAIGRAEPPTL